VPATALIPGAEPFAADGAAGDGSGAGRVGVVISHGFTGTPASVRSWAEHLAAAGIAVRVPLLPGHGTSWQDANTTRWPDWFRVVEAAYDELTASCAQVFAAGLSMGGTLVTRLAEVKGAGVSGLVLVNPSYATTRTEAKLARYIAWAVRSRPGIASDINKPGVTEPGYDRTPVRAFVSLQDLWAITLRDLGRVTAPVLLYRSRQDHVVEPLSARLLLARATSTSVREVVLEHSYHVATMDNDAPTIFSGSLEFIRSLSAGRPDGDPAPEADPATATGPAKEDTR
jgi:carboxylesterase